MAQFTTPDGNTIAFDVIGSGPPVLLLHGFPQTRAMWHGIAPTLARQFTVATPDLRGYGASSAPATMPEMSFRPMASDMVALLQHLGHTRAHIVGHDRGGRTAHRLALDHPDLPLSLTVMDIVPTHHLLANVTKEVATAYYHWFFLAQPEPFPETLIGFDPDAYFESCLAGWGGGIDGFDAAALGAYRATWRAPDTIRAMCNDYRAAIAVDFDLDAADLDRTVGCPALVLFGADGIMAREFDVPETLTPQLSDMRSCALPGGHFFPDTHPEETAQELLSFLASA